MQYKFDFQIGDWSGDGHGISRSVIVESNMPIEKVRELYFKACKKAKFGFDSHYKTSIGVKDDGYTNEAPFSNYEDFSTTLGTLKRLLSIEDLLSLGFEFDNPEDDDEEVEGLDAELLASMVLLFIKRASNNKFEYQIVTPERMPTFAFYGYDKKNRHIGFIGYGLFSN